MGKENTKSWRGKARGWMDLEWLILKRMFLEDWRTYAKTICYLILVLSLMLILSSADRVRYDNQLRFLKGAGYRSVTEDVPALKASFYVFDGEAALTEDVRGALIYRYEAAAQIFLITEEHPDFEHTPFTEANLQGNDPAGLKDGEALISYDLSRRLHVRAGDTIMLFPWEGEGEVSVRVAGVMKTKYKRGEIGYTGTILLRDNRDSTLQVFPGGSGLVFHADETGTLSIEEEKRECRALSSNLSAIASIDLLFPVCAFALLGFVLVRESRRIKRRWTRRFQVMRLCGACEGIGGRSIALMSGLLLVPALWAASVLYRVLFMDLLAGEYMSVFFSIRQGIWILAGSLLILYVAAREKKTGKEALL